MNTYLISYDLIRPGKDYAELHKAIRALGTYAHVLDSTWIVRYAGQAATLREMLKKHIDSNDKLLVAGLNGAWASYNLQTEVAGWMQSNMVA